MQSKSALDYEGRVFRCFVVYDCNKQQVLISIKRHCGNLFTETILKVKEYVKQNLYDSQRNQVNIPGGSRCEWHGILDEKTNCYFLMMTFPGSHQSAILQSLLELQQIVLYVPNYQNLNESNFPPTKKNDLLAKLDELEQQYVKDIGPEGQPDETEKGIQQEQQRSTSNQFLVSTPQYLLLLKSLELIQLDNLHNNPRFRIYRCFMIYNVVGNKTLFCLKRGTSKSFDDTKGSIINQLKKQLQETTKFEVFAQGNQRCEWHGILDEKKCKMQLIFKACYFLMMTFPSTTKKNVIEALEDLKKTFIQIPNYDAIQPNDLERRVKQDVQKQIDNLEIKYFNLNGNEGVASDNEQSEIRRDFITSNQITQTTKLNPPSAIKESDSYNPPEIQESGKNLYDTLEINAKKELEELAKFKPMLQDAQTYIYVGIGITFTLFLTLIIIIA
ncbi:unnamed protein product (macronuclear) [Paramecium tetraurelia]|uniref:Uncharacterized protein n=1 Tax=Paramecium tetraurelia TaxID=5888 RepID=A0CLH0_PARTE|nr:uncharacterized protein GSPATT00008185001 [Paramecium tetraurelia]CAK71637.1 unnamed protein product [Paramecium tetraurelia]|eukprot:XP_001439034.1 hypothetical protein (macronuclear) [Paramecium tetraurelia strain d4-2]